MIHKIGAVITQDKKLLVVRKHVEGRTEYIIPGGKPEGEETPEETLARELKEELDVEITSTHYVDRYEEPAAFEDDLLRMDVYDTEIRGTPVAHSEIKEILWIDRKYQDKGIKLGSVLAKHVIPRLMRESRM